MEDLGEFDPTMKKKKKKKKEAVPDGEDLPLDNDLNGKITSGAKRGTCSGQCGFNCFLL